MSAETLPTAGGVPQRVLSVAEVATLLSMTRRGLEKLIRAGHGPEVLRIGVRRRGVRVSDYHRWLDSRDKK